MIQKMKKIVIVSPCQRKAALLERLAQRMELRLQNHHRVMLDPTGLGIDLRKGVLRQRDDIAAAVKNDRTGTRRALVQRDDVAVHSVTSNLKMVLRK